MFFNGIDNKRGETQGSNPLSPQISGQVEVSNRAIKNSMSKEVNDNRTDRSRKIDDELWVYKLLAKNILQCPLMRWFLVNHFTCL